MPAGVLNFATVPSGNLERLKQRLETLVSSLSASLGFTVRMRVPQSYEAVLDGMMLAEWDLVVLGPQLWLNGVAQGAKYRPVVRPIRAGKSDYRAAIYVRRAASIHHIDQLARRRVAFVDRASTAGFVVPRAAMSRAGVSLQALGHHTFAGTHQNVLNLVHSGRAEAGCSFVGAIESLGDANPALAQDLEILWSSEPIPNEVYALSDDFCARNPDAFERIREFMSSLHTHDAGREALTAMHDNVDRFDPVDAATYEAARPMLRRT